MVKLFSQLLHTCSNSVVYRNRNLVKRVYFQSTYNYDNELMELEELRNCCLRSINNLSNRDLFYDSAVKELLYIRQTDACFQKLRHTLCFIHFCVKV